MPCIVFNSKSIEYSLIRSKRRTISLNISNKGEVVLRCPLRVTDEKAVQFLEKKASWVLKHLDQISKREYITLNNKYISREIHYYLGNKYILETLISDKEGVSIAGDKILVSQSSGDERKTEKIYLNWLNKEIERIFLERYRQIITRFEYDTIPRVQVKTMKSRWGSFRTTGVISLNKKLIHAPIKCLDYVITHELCHYKYMNHGKRFHALLKKMYPEYKDTEKNLKSYESLL